MSDERYMSLREAAWRRPLSEAERADLSAWLATHPAARPDWESEAALNAGLRKLSDAPMPSNFTARVLREIERERPATERGRIRAGKGWRRWLPRFAVGTVALVAVWATLHFHQAARPAKIGASLAVLSEVTPAPVADYLADFDSILKLAPAPGADRELLSLLQ